LCVEGTFNPVENKHPQQKFTRLPLTKEKYPLLYKQSFVLLHDPACVNIIKNLFDLFN